MIFETIKDFIATQLGKNDVDITLESDIINDVGLDSLDIVDLIMEIEDRWGVVADDEDIKTLKTIGDVVSYIEKALK